MRAVREHEATSELGQTSRVLIAVDDFTATQVERIRNAVQEWSFVRRILQNAPEEKYRAELREANVVVGWPQPRWLLGTRVRFVQIGSAGWDAYENVGLENSGIVICSGRGIYSIGVAEHCIAMMLALSRRLPLHFRDQQQRIFRRHPPYGEIVGKTACIVGLGSIGMELVKRCKALGMHVIGVASDRSKKSPEIDEIFSVGELKAAIRKATHVFMTAPGCAANMNLFSREVLEVFSPATYFYNISRGSTVDEAALCERLANGKLAGCGLDVTLTEPLRTDSPLWDLGDNVLITGHSAGLSEGHPERFCQLVIRNLARFHQGDPLENRVL
jgi:D-2-hydroxyacid dehydrogenase (NADP+)